MEKLFVSWKVPVGRQEVLLMKVLLEKTYKPLMKVTDELVVSVLVAFVSTTAFATAWCFHSPSQYSVIAIGFPRLASSRATVGQRESLEDYGIAPHNHKHVSSRPMPTRVELHTTS